MSETSVRGAGRPRAGATDTTMLIWKVIVANPGITRQGIWERVKYGIPEGYAKRRYAVYRKTCGSGGRTGGGRIIDESQILPEVARSYVLSHALRQMHRSGVITQAGDGEERVYTAAKEPRYRGNAAAVDETGTKAGEHMAVADALRTAEKWLARAKPDRVDSLGRRSVPVLGPPSRKEYEALTLVVKALRAKGSSEG